MSKKVKVDSEDMLVIPDVSNPGFVTTPGSETLPAGGTTGQQLVKASNADFDMSWQTQPEAANVPDLTDNSGGASGGDTIAVIDDVQNAGSADLAATQNAIATLAAKVNDILAALEAANLMA